MWKQGRGGRLTRGAHSPLRLLPALKTSGRAASDDELCRLRLRRQDSGSQGGKGRAEAAEREGGTCCIAWLHPTVLPHAHLITQASPSFLYNPIFALGIDALCDTFLEGMSSAAEKDELRDALITALGLDVKQVLQDASSLRAIAEQCTTEEELLQAAPLAAIAALPAVPPFKYSYAFGAGLLTLMPMVCGVPVYTKPERGTWLPVVTAPYPRECPPMRSGRCRAIRLVDRAVVLGHQCAIKEAD
eukprot:scaffold127776_cov32-Tisochrysis_lutea.AAC.2